MEELLIAISKLGLTENEAMNYLQDHGVISDLCVSIRDISGQDLSEAIAFFKTFPL